MPHLCPMCVPVVLLPIVCLSYYCINVFNFNETAGCVRKCNHGLHLHGHILRRCEFHSKLVACRQRLSPNCLIWWGSVCIGLPHVLKTCSLSKTQRLTPKCWSQIWEASQTWRIWLQIVCIGLPAFLKAYRFSVCFQDPCPLLISERGSYHEMGRLMPPI